MTVIDLSNFKQKTYPYNEQPVLVLRFPNGKTYIRCSGKAAELGVVQAAEEMGFDIETRRYTDIRGEERYGEINTVIENDKDYPRFLQYFKNFVLPHGYSFVAPGFAAGNSDNWLWRREGFVPPTSSTPYLFIVDFGNQHGGAWVFGSPRDINNTHEATVRNDFLKIVNTANITIDDERRVDAYSVSSETVDRYKFMLEKFGVVHFYDDFICTCHQSF